VEKVTKSEKRGQAKPSSRTVEDESLRSGDVTYSPSEFLAVVLLTRPERHSKLSTKTGNDFSTRCSGFRLCLGRS
jgi:hypothetical protein